MKRENLHLREHDAGELAHYAASCADVEYDFPFGRSELEGIANRTDFDLRQHTEWSGKDLSYFDDQEPDPEKRRYVPHVIEPSAGADRATLAFLCDAYSEDEVGGEPRTALKRRFNVFYDEKGAIGRRYRRQDEAGTPYCITVDGDTLAGGTVTVRERDSCAQTRVHSSELTSLLAERVGG
jgi:glycyl-tRNA synthetase